MAMTKLKLAADERPRVLYTYTVRGAGVFPYDMLRYDSCYPASQRDVVSMGATGDRAVSLRSYYAPTVGRWQSFSWEVWD